MNTPDEPTKYDPEGNGWYHRFRAEPYPPGFDPDNMKPAPGQWVPQTFAEAMAYAMTPKPVTPPPEVAVVAHEAQITKIEDRLAQLESLLFQVVDRFAERGAA